MRTRTAAAAFLLCLATLPAHPGDGASVADVAVPTARGTDLRATLHRPAAGNGTAVVLAPGQGYHKDLPLIRGGAEALAGAGFTVLRFDWAYFTAKGEPSDEFGNEVADLGAAVAHARALEGVTRVLVAGKSLGSLVAVRFASAQRDACDGLALLTLPVNEPGKPDTPYGDEEQILSLPFEPLIVCGDADPLADRGALYRLAARMAKPPRVVVLPGDHSFKGPAKDDAENAENVELAIRTLVVWAKRRARD